MRRPSACRSTVFPSARSRDRPVQPGGDTRGRSERFKPAGPTPTTTEEIRARETFEPQEATRDRSRSVDGLGTGCRATRPHRRPHLPF